MNGIAANTASTGNEPSRIPSAAPYTTPRQRISAANVTPCGWALPAPLNTIAESRPPATSPSATDHFQFRAEELPDIHAARPNPRAEEHEHGHRVDPVVEVAGEADHVREEERHEEREEGASAEPGPLARVFAVTPHGERRRGNCHQNHLLGGYPILIAGIDFHIVGIAAGDCG